MGEEEVMFCPGCILAGFAVWYIVYWDRTKVWVSGIITKIKGVKNE
jgi:hypothetical protein